MPQGPGANVSLMVRLHRVIVMSIQGLVSEDLLDRE